MIQLNDRVELKHSSKIRAMTEGHACAGAGGRVACIDTEGYALVFDEENPENEFRCTFLDIDWKKT